MSPAFRFYPLVLILLYGLLTTSAQDLTCAAVVEEAFQSLGHNCADLARNSLCYGYPEVDASFAPDYPLSDFTGPTDRTSVLQLESVATGELNLEDSSWGVAVLNLGANLPLTYKGPGVLILLAGAAEIINETDITQVMEIGEPLGTVALQEATRFKLPGVIPQPVGDLNADELLLVDAFDGTGEWLRVVTDGTLSWVETDKLARLKAMETLPRLEVGQAFALQSLALSTGTSYPECDEAEPMVAIQTPKEMSVSLTVNGVDIHIGSMVTFQQVHRNALSLTVHRGEVTTIFGQTVTQGESVVGILGTRAQREAEVLDWSGALHASEAELARGQRAQAAINAVASVNDWPQFETFSMPPDIYYIVQRGDGLYRIARQFETSVAAIISANQIDEPFTLYAGMELRIPEPGSGFAGRWSPADTPEAADSS